MQVILFHLNNLMPPAQSARAYHWEKLGERSCRVELLGEAFELKLPAKEKIIVGVKGYWQRSPVEKITCWACDRLEEMKTRSLRIAHWLGQQWEGAREVGGIDLRHISNDIPYISQLWEKIIKTTIRTVNYISNVTAQTVQLWENLSRTTGNYRNSFLKTQGFVPEEIDVLNSHFLLLN